MHRLRIYRLAWLFLVLARPYQALSLVLSGLKQAHVQCCQKCVLSWAVPFPVTPTGLPVHPLLQG
jgi:hypothetical protein